MNDGENPFLSKCPESLVINKSVIKACDRINLSRGSAIVSQVGSGLGKNLTCLFFHKLIVSQQYLSHTEKLSSLLGCIKVTTPCLRQALNGI